MRFGQLMKKNSNVLLLLESLSEGREKGNMLGISHLNSVVLHGTRASFDVQVIEAADFYINYRTKSNISPAPILYRFGM